MKILLFRAFNDRLNVARALEKNYWQLKNEILFYASGNNHLNPIKKIFDTFENNLIVSGVVDVRSDKFDKV